MLLGPAHHDGQELPASQAATCEELRGRTYNGDTAIVTGLQVMCADGDKPLPKRRVGSVWVKVERAWKHADYQVTLVSDGFGGAMSSADSNGKGERGHEGGLLTARQSGRLTMDASFRVSGT